MRSMPVRKGGWCIISKTGRAGAEARTWSSQSKPRRAQ
jgi:hypothetical protein